MVEVQRLNMDASWFMNWDDHRFIIDPWLVGSEIDGGPWLNQQWHRTPPVPIEELPEHNFYVITQSYEDHCHTPTLKLLDTKRPILATGKAFKKLHNSFPHRQNIRIPEIWRGQCMYYKKLAFWAIRPNKLLDPIYYALLIFNEKKDAIFYCPHGFELTDREIEKISFLNFRLLFTTLIDFRLPAILGGHVNPGVTNAEHLIDRLQPDHVINTHDEDKRAKGLVSSMAKVSFPDFEEIKKKKGFPFLESPDYRPLRFDF
jgi:hypothetical protein